MYRINPSGDIVVNLYISLSSLSHRAALSVFFFAICGVPSRKVCQPLRVSLKGVSENGLSPEIANLIGKMDENGDWPMEFSQKNADSPWISPLGSWMTRGIFRQTHNALTSSKFSPHASRGSSRSLLADLFKVLTCRLMIPNSFMVYFMVYFMEHPTEKWMIWGTPWYPPFLHDVTWCWIYFYDIVILTSLAGTLWASDLAIHWREPWVWFLVVHFYQSSSRFRCSTFWTCKVRNPIPVTSRWKLIYENHGKPNSSAPRNISGSPRNRCRGCRHLPQLGSSQYWSRWKAMENEGCPWDIYGVLMGFNGIQWMVILW